MSLDFNRFAERGNEFLNTLARELGYPNDKPRAGRVLTSILHSLRRHLTTEESIQVLAQFPMFLKAVYVAGWSTHQSQKKARNTRELFLEIRDIHGPVSQNDFPSDEHLDKAVGVVFRLLGRYVSSGEFEDLRAVLPKKLKAIIPLPSIPSQTP